MKPHNLITVIPRKDARMLGINHRIVEESPDLIAVVGSDFTFHYVNPAYARVHGRSQREFVGCTLAEFLGEEAFEEIVKPRLATCFEGEDVRYQEWFGFPDTGPMFMDVRYLPLSGESEGVQRIVIIHRDISYLKEAEDARRATEKLETVVELAATYNHEINNPLCALGGFIELLAAGEEDEGRRTYLEKARQEVNRIAGVTKKISEATSLRTVDYPGGGRILDISSDDDVLSAGGE